MNTYYLNQWPKLTVSDTILECNFAIPNYRPSLKERLNAWKNKDIIADPSNFVEQLQKCTVLALHGGDTPTLINTLNTIEGWQEHLVNKKVFATSAGISALMKWSFNVDHMFILQGLGILPFKSIVHYNDGMRGLANLLYLHPKSKDVPMLLFGNGDCMKLVL